MTTQAQVLTIAGMPAGIRDAIYDHVFPSDDVEVAGVLVGAVDAAGRAEVHGMIAALEADGSRASVTFTHDAWREIIEIQERDFPDSPTIVGWYHSHPGFGIFLSEHDVFIQQNFFREPFHVAYVIDPQAEIEGMFGWQDGQIVLLEEGSTTRGRTKRRPVVVDLETPPTMTIPRPEQRSVPRSEEARHRVTIETVEESPRRRGFVPLLGGGLLLACVAMAIVVFTNSSAPGPVSGKPKSPTLVSPQSRLTAQRIQTANSDATLATQRAQGKQKEHDDAIAAAKNNNGPRGGGQTGGGQTGGGQTGGGQTGGGQTGGGQTGGGQTGGGQTGGGQTGGGNTAGGKTGGGSACSASGFEC